MDDKKILDVTCGSRTIWFNKEHPATVYCDIREEELTGIWKSGDGQAEEMHREAGYKVRLHSSSV